MNEIKIVSIDAVIDKIKICGYIDCDEYDGYYDEYEYDNILYYLEKYKNLQSKIDKANEYLEEYFIFDDKNGEYYQTHTFDKDNAKELHDILKEDK